MSRVKKNFYTLATVIYAFSWLVILGVYFTASFINLKLKLWMHHRRNLHKLKSTLRRTGIPPDLGKLIMEIYEDRWRLFSSTLSTKSFIRFIKQISNIRGVENT
jgi:uncharacterized membrane protein YbhN (UPF0104 family)